MNAVRLALFSFFFLCSAAHAGSCSSTEIEPFASYKTVSVVCSSGTSLDPSMTEGVGNSIPGQWITEFQERNPGVTLTVCDEKVRATIDGGSQCGGRIIYTYVRIGK